MGWHNELYSTFDKVLYGILMALIQEIGCRVPAFAPPTAGTENW